MNFIKKWYTYQKERFPILIFGIYMLSIAFGTFVYCYYIGKNNYEIFGPGTLFYLEQPQYLMIIPMFIVAFLQFLMIRIIDEFKDYEEDCKYRPYRPVPRGLIKLNELKVLFVICAIIQIAMAWEFNVFGILFLIPVWLFFALMSKGFFIKKFLDKHMLAEVALDELLMPILVTFLASFVYIGTDLWKLLLMSYIISWIVEVARKVRCKEDEEEGVRTYSAVFGIKGAVLILFILETLLMITQILILGTKYLPMIIGIYIFVNIINVLFAIKKTKNFAKATELSANINIMLAYLSLGLLSI